MNKGRKVYRIEGRTVRPWVYLGTYTQFNPEGEQITCVYAREGESNRTYGIPFLGEYPHYATRAEALAAMKGG